MLMPSLESLQRDGHIGDWAFDESHSHLFFRIDTSWTRATSADLIAAGEKPRGILTSIPIDRAGGVNSDTQPVWGWDGNEEAPTITPSINMIGEWHGWLRAGKFVDA